MMLPVLLIFWVVLKLSQGFQDNILHDRNVTGVLGEDVYLRCRYTGDNSVEYSGWSRHDSSKKLAGYKHNGQNYSRDSNFDVPASPYNLTVKVRIESFKMEGLYTCTFSTDEDEPKEYVYLTVIARPHVKTQLKVEYLDGIWYQTVSCSASNAKPMPLLHWEIHGAHPSKDVYSIHTNKTTLPDDTTSVFSSLGFPIHLNNESSVTCVIEHPALSKPNRTVVALQTFVAAHVSMEMATIHKEDKEFFEVKCKAKGGRPHPTIKWILPENRDTAGSQSNDTGLDAVSTYWFPSDLYEGENVTCVFGYPHHPSMNSTSVTLPKYALTSIQLTYNGTEIDKETAPDTPLILMEGDSSIIITMKAMGSVPSYKINCSKDGEPLPEEVHVTNSSLFIKGPVNLSTAGKYHCQASYNRHSTHLRFDIDLKPAIILPVGFPPNISVTLKKETDHIYLECLASDASPAANVLWVVPEDLERTIQSNITSSNGLHSVRSILMLPACTFQNQTVECVVEHFLLTDQDRRPVALPVCVAEPINVTLRSKTTWEKNGFAYTEVKCSADNVIPNTTIRWETEICKHEVTPEVKSQEEHGVLVNIARLPALSYAGCTVVCVVEHQGLKRPITKSLKFPLLGRPVINVIVGPQADSPFWAATCEYEGAGFIPNISWVTSNNTVLPSHIHNSTSGVKVLLKSTYSFSLSQREGQPLTCSIQNAFGQHEIRTINVPKYFILSITVLNYTRAQSERRDPMCTVTLQKYVPDQKIVFKINGNASGYDFKCFRPSGLGALTIDMALVFAEPVLDGDAGLYTCNASWFHLNATVFFQVKVANREEHRLTLIFICFSSAAAIFIILMVMLCIVCRKGAVERRPSAKSRRNRESLSALMQDPRSPELKKAGGRGQEYAELVHYSIVVDMKTTV